MNRNEQEMYKNIERIATALEKLVAQGKEDKLDKFKKAANLLYGNDATVKPSEGRSDDNYTYPEFADKHYTVSGSHDKAIEARDPYMKAANVYADAIQSGVKVEEATKEYTTIIQKLLDKGQDVANRTDLEQRMYDEAQSCTGGEFQGWFNKLTKEERDAYSSVYGH